MDRVEFHRRHAAMGEGVRAELIEGVVHLHCEPDGFRPRVSFEAGSTSLHAAGWLGEYERRTPGLVSAGRCTVFADHHNEVQPDILVGIPDSTGGQTRLVRQDRRTWVACMPEFVVEVAASTARVDLGQKRQVYERNGAAEYLVLLPEREPAEAIWFVANAEGTLVPIDPDPADGLLKSRVLPGLWLDVEALYADDLPRLAAAVEAGCVTPEHVAFRQRLSAARPTVE